MTIRTAGKLGRTPNLGRRRVTLTAEHMGATYSPPATLDRYSAVPASTWGMDGNDSVGDCTCADVDHEVKSVQVAAGNTEVSSTQAEVLAAYSAITGYNPDNPDSDQGAEMQAVREYWQKTGFKLGGQVHKVALFADLDHENTTLVKYGLAEFGAVGLGVNLPNSAMDQFNAGEPWTVVKGSGIDGGHAIALVGYDLDWFYILTWGQVQKVAPAWFATYVEEAWVVLTEDFVNVDTGRDPLGGVAYDLGEQFAQVTGKPNPFPVPNPAPVPAPPVVPPAPVDGADGVLAAALRPWLAERHTGDNQHAKLAVEAWLAEKDL